MTGQPFLGRPTEGPDRSGRFKAGIVGTGACGVCGNLTEFDPDEGPSVYIDPATKLPPDVDPHPDGKGMLRALREPLCEFCIEAFNQDRKAKGEPMPFPGWGITT